MLTPRDEGSLTVLIIGYLLVASVLVVAAVDVSSVFLARRALESTADAAALAGAQEIDRSVVYSGGVGMGCGDGLPVDASAAADAVDRTVSDAVPDLSRMFTNLDAPQTATDGGVVDVRLSGDVGVPFGRVIAVLLPGVRPSVHVAVSAHAATALSAPAGC